MKERLSLCVATQTPAARFEVDLGEIYNKYGEAPEPLPLDMLSEGEDYSQAPGGVTQLLPSLLQDLENKNTIKKPHWISLNPLGPEIALSETAILHSVNLPPRESALYGRFKEEFWKNIHGVEQGPIPKEDFRGYALYNWLSAKKMLDLHSENEFDLFYIHDFQLLPVGSMIGPAAPKLYRWHTPLNFGYMLPQWQNFLLNYLNNFDATIVSCEEYKRSLLESGFDGDVYQLYPPIDPNEYGEISDVKIRKSCDKYNIDEGDQIILVVARLDPMKGQDIAIKGFTQIAKDYPDAKLVLIGNGSFSSSKKGGLGLPKGLRWKRELEDLASSLGVSDRIIFTGFVPGEELEAFLARSDVLILPSVLEGFGLTVLEGWEYEKPVIVSSETGVAELARDGKNSYVFNPSNPRELSEKIAKTLADPELADELGKKGRETAKQCHLSRISEKLSEIFLETLSK
ncbi:hypothetical protein AKJ57_00535 [candidate division MSBL1 archaeon SCGC-AAA259A05]|uniref:Uncharacterized protein n=1 Tax=candidate division MSBL1 archaeon SCGC-AAA259A05 TaxID=1698259 RepID=A0A133UBQ6_9EURY|nr:hypothetical protein AKJ57_00535 [candidate division MSBL1 archaeon SCGC-AAA259A05]